MTNKHECTVVERCFKHWEPLKPLPKREAVRMEAARKQIRA